MFSSRIYIAQLVAGVILLCSVSMLGDDTNKKKPAPPPKPAPAAARPAQPASPGASGGAANRGGSTAGPTTHSGPTANGMHTGPTANSGPTANRPAGVTTAHPAVAPTVGTRPTALGAGASIRAPSAHPVNVGISGRPAPTGARQVRLRGGDAIQRRADGRVSDVHDAKRGMDVHHGLNGGQRVSVERADRSRVVAERGRPGYVQRSYSYHGHEFARRSYYYNGHMHENFYRGYGYRGVSINVYAPVRYYSVGFYGWAYNPWAVPVAYAWGFGGSPWYGYYGYYFSPFPVYPNASLWLTDYMISSDLDAAYQAGKDSAALPPSEQSGNAPPALTPEVKLMIATEVHSQIALENNEAQQSAVNQDIDPASSSIARSFSDGHTHVFVAGGALDVVDDAGMECALSDGDVLQLATLPPPDATAASLVVLSSKGRRECSKSATVTVALVDLQEMQNHMRESIDRGMEELRAKQGKGGLPMTPPSAAVSPSVVAFTGAAPPPDPNDANAISNQLKSADQSEQEMTTQARSEGDVSNRAQ